MENITFSVSSKNLKVKESLKKDFLELEMYVISDACPNRNNSSFVLEGMHKALPTFYNKPVLGYFNDYHGDFEEHNASKLKIDKDIGDFYHDYNIRDGERALGIVRESDTVEIVQHNGENWIRITCAVWCKYNRNQIKKLLLDKKKKVSVEITCSKFSYKEGSDIKYIEEFCFDAVTILGNIRGTKIPCDEGIAGAHLKLLNFINTEAYSMDKLALNFAYNGNRKAKIVRKLNDDEFNTTELFAKITVCENINEIVNSVFLKVDENWEEDPITRLKYPIVSEIEEGLYCYNKNAIEMSFSTAIKDKDKEAVDKIRKLQREFGLLKKANSNIKNKNNITEKEEVVKMNFANIPENFSLIFSTENLGIFVKDGVFYSHCIEGESTNFSEDALRKLNISCLFNEDESEVDMTENLFKLFSELKEKEEVFTSEVEKFKEDAIANEATIAELNSAIENFSAKEIELKEAMEAKEAENLSLKESTEELSAKFEETQKELESLKESVHKAECEKMKEVAKNLADENDISEDEFKNVSFKCENGEYSCVEDIKKDIAYLCYLKAEKEREQKKEQFKAGLGGQTNDNAPKTNLDRLKQI